MPPFSPLALPLRLAIADRLQTAVGLTLGHLLLILPLRRLLLLFARLILGLLLLLGLEEADSVFQVLHRQPLVLEDRLEVVRLRARRLARFVEKDRGVVHLSGGCSRLHRRLS